MSVSAYLKLSVAVALATIVLKTAAWWISGSVSLLSDALEALVNLAGATFALLMVSVAAHPADEGHPYGHHKAEYFSSGFEGVLILVAALAIIAAAWHRLWHPQPLQMLGWGLGLSLVSTALNGALARAMLRMAVSLFMPWPPRTMPPSLLNTPPDGQPVTSASASASGVASE